MENKLTWVELKKVVARQTELTEKEVNTILTAWLDEMVAALKRGEELHINGLGTFKMKTMKARKSVDVTTGEAIILPETDRLTFAMAASLEEQLRDDAPVRMEVGKDPIQKLSDQADEIMDIIGEIKAIGQEGEEEKERESEEVRRQEDKEAKSQEGEKGEKKPAKKERLWLTAGITIIVFIALLIGSYFFFQHKLEQWIQNLRQQAEMVEDVNANENANVNVNTNENVLVMESESVSESVRVRESVDYRKYTEFIAEENMHQGSRLAWMAYRYYGNKQLWVFIYDANKDHIANPEQIEVGTPVRIPKLSQDILKGGEDIQALIKQMEKEFLGSR